MGSDFRLPNMIAGFLMLAASIARAEVSAQGPPEVVHLEAKDANLGEVLHALRDTYGLGYKSNIPLNARVSGTYDGPLPQVLSRLLAGNNYVLTKTGNTFQVTIVSSPGSAPISAAAPAPVFPNPETKTSAKPPAVPPGLVFPPLGPVMPLGTRK